MQVISTIFVYDCSALLVHVHMQYKSLEARKGKVKANGREPKSCLGWFFRSKLGSFAQMHSKCHSMYAANSRVESSAHVKSCQPVWPENWIKYCPIFGKK